MSRTRAVIGLVVNVVAPGVGSLILGEWMWGGLQLLVLAVIWFLRWITFGFAGFLLWPVQGLDLAFGVVLGILAVIQSRPSGSAPYRSLR